MLGPFGQVWWYVCGVEFLFDFYWFLVADWGSRGTNHRQTARFPGMRLVTSGVRTEGFVPDWLHLRISGIPDPLRDLTFIQPCSEFVRFSDR